MAAKLYQYPLVLGSGRMVRKGRGFSVGELKEARISLEEARRLRIYIDQRRKTVHKENVEVLNDMVELIRRGELPPPVRSKPAERRRVGSPARGRAFRGLTAAGKRSRGLYKVKERRHPQHKWG